ncbi:MAG: Fibronectin type protein [Bacilli bacterium]|nr:Fibronectin type protein [Bacilli bacterium]
MFKKFSTRLVLMLTFTLIINLVSVPVYAETVPTEACSTNCHMNNAAFLNADWFAYAQTSANIQTYVSELAAKKIKYQFADIGLLNNTSTSTNGALSAYNYAGLAQWIKFSKQTDPNQLIIIDLNYSDRFTRVNGVKVANPNFGNATFNKNLNALIHKLVNVGIQIGGTGPFYKADGVHLDIEGFMQNDNTLLNTLKYLRNHALITNTNFSMSTPVDPTYSGTVKYQWSNAYIAQVAAVLNMINPMIYDQMGWGSDIYTTADYQKLWTDEITRYSKAIGNIGPGSIASKLVPTLPSYAMKVADDSTIYHDPAVENIHAALSGLNAAINLNSAMVHGVGIFWWSNFIGRNAPAYPAGLFTTDQSDWMTMWVNQI